MRLESVAIHPAVFLRATSPSVCLARGARLPLTNLAWSDQRVPNIAAISHKRMFGFAWVRFVRFVFRIRPLKSIPLSEIRFARSDTGGLTRTR
jgi:hypothetical protein